MKKNNLKQLIKESGCIEGGTKEACLKVREVLRYAIDGGDKLIVPRSQVKMNEFIEAVKILTTFASSRPDEYVEMYFCDIDCARISGGCCPGDCMLSEKATKRCPHYIEEDV